VVVPPRAKFGEMAKSFATWHIDYDIVVRVTIMSSGAAFLRVDMWSLWVSGKFNC
jgi:hypothetical protein